MADFLSSQSTVLDVDVWGKARVVTLGITAFTTGVAADTVATPLTRVLSAFAVWDSSAALGTNTIGCAISTASPASVVVTHSTHANLPVRITVIGR